MGQRSLFLLLLRPLPGQRAGKEKGVQRKLSHEPSAKQGLTALCSNNQQARTAKTPACNITACGKHPNSKRDSSQGGDSSGAGILAWAIPPLIVLAFPQKTSHNGSAVTPKGTGTPTTDNSRQSSVPPPRMSSSGRLAILDEACETPARSMNDTKQ